MSNRRRKKDGQQGFLQEEVVEHFVAASDVYAHRSGIVHLEADPIILDFVRARTNADPARILEVGGGNGYLLDLLANEVPATQLLNCELAYQAYRKQANSRIRLVGGNALSLPFAESEFDYVIAKNLLHHLVGSTRDESKALAQRASMELRRVIRKGGHLIVLEQYHQYRLCAAVLFYLTLMLSRINFQWKALGIRSQVVVSFLTPSEIRSLFDRSHASRDEALVDRAAPLPVSFPTSLFPFLSRFGRLLLIKRVHK